MATYYLAPSLVRLRDAINKRWPRRDKTSDGWIGDTGHQARYSDHNPDWGQPDPGIVRAIDVDKDGISTAALLDEVIGHPAVQYVIFKGRIWSVSWGWKARAYHGVNAHEHHVHVSLRHTHAADYWPGKWLSTDAAAPAKPAARKVTLTRYLRQGSTGTAVKNLQKALHLKADGKFGPKTYAATKAFQRKHHLAADGVVGSATARALGWNWKG